jgi:hypothetical protein
MYTIWSFRFEYKEMGSNMKHIVKKKSMQNCGSKAAREELLGGRRHRWEDTEMDISCEDVNMIDLNDGCVQWHHFMSTVVSLMSR